MKFPERRKLWQRIKIMLQETEFPEAAKTLHQAAARIVPVVP
jgi:hypothetical protein